MRHTLLDSRDGRRRFVLVLDAGDEALAAIRRFAADQQLAGASITGIGAFARCTFGHFDPATKEFTRNSIDAQAEVLALIGNIAAPDAPPDDDGDDPGDGPLLHIHCVVGLRDASARGGHLVEGFVRPTMELIIEESPTHLQRGHDRASGLVLLQPNLAKD
jgi:predicted DNA-binding protein with PD1-like motif